jgi:hypothetical protein
MLIHILLCTFAALLSAMGGLLVWILLWHWLTNDQERRRRSGDDAVSGRTAFVPSSGKFPPAHA